MAPRPRFIVPEVIQTSKVDCGPAALKALLAGFDIPASYSGLRDLCHTDVDGTSVDRLEEVANESGLDAEQVVVPVDHVLMTEARVLPGILVVTSATGYPHLVLAWRTHGRVVQVMDPARGRLWMTHGALVRQMYIHTAVVPQEDWRAWASTDEFIAPLRRRLSTLGLSRSEIDALVARADGDPGPRGMAALDAATRLVATLRSSGAVSARDAIRAVTAFADTPLHGESAIPEQYWSVRPASSSADGAARLAVRGAVVLRARRGHVRVPVGENVAPDDRDESHLGLVAVAGRLLNEDGAPSPWVIGGLLGVLAGGGVAEVLMLRSLIETDASAEPTSSLRVLGAFALVAAALLVIDWVIAIAERRVGARFESRLRAAILEKIPRLEDRYFHSRPRSDMAERSHAIHQLRGLPALGMRAMRIAVELAITAAALAILAPPVALVAVIGAVVATAIPLLGHSLIAERDLRQRTHAGALSRFQLDALLGRTAIDAHRAGTMMAREHERLLEEWARAGAAVGRATLLMEGLQLITGLAVTIFLLRSPIGAYAAGAGLLLFVYWALQLPALGYELAAQLQEYPWHRNVLQRVLEPLSGREEPGAAVVPSADVHPKSPGVAIEFRGVTIAASGKPILAGVSVSIAPGAHVAIVGPSGAGKSTLAGTLLGWQQPDGGDVFVDGWPLRGEAVAELRQRTAWVDPTVQIWNRSLLENLRYGVDGEPEIDAVIEDAELLDVIARLPHGLSAGVGHCGSLLSAGEAQRVRLARALLGAHPALAVLDEPLRGIERERRRRLIGALRRRWSDGTLLYITHDIGEAALFERVLVIEGGRLVEDGAPQLLLQRASSRYRRLLHAQEGVHAKFTRGEWRRIVFTDGKIEPHDKRASLEQTA